jgi:hypothetical protein
MDINAKDSANFSSHFFLGKMLHLSGFIPPDKSPSFEAHDGSVFRHMSVGLLNIFYCALQELFTALWGLDKTERNGSSDVRLH